MLASLRLWIPLDRASLRAVRELLHRILFKTYLFVDLDEVTNIAIQILEQKAMCQQDPDQDENEEPLEDSAEYDSVLISSAGDLVAAIANTLGADFAPAFENFYPLITRYYVSHFHICE